MLVGGEHAEGDRLVRGAFDLARAAHADAMPVREKLRHHHRVIRRVAAPAVVVRVEDRGQVQRLYRLAHEVRQMALGEPVVQARRHQRRLVGVIRTEVSLVFHARHYSMAVKWYSDRLLDAEADDRLVGAKRYERSPDRVDTRAGHYERGLHTVAGPVKLRVPKLRKLPFETEIPDGPLR